MRRLCERPGCSEPVSASYGIDNANLVVWLDSAPSPDPVLAGSLCRRHADALVVPRGWHIDDRREEIPRLFPSPVPTDSSVSTDDTPSKGARKRALRAVATASLFDADNPPLAEIDDAPTTGESDVLASTTQAVVNDIPTDDELEETRAIPWMPRIVGRVHDDEADGEDSTVDATPAQGRLLRRAFGDRNVR